MSDDIERVQQLVKDTEEWVRRYRVRLAEKSSNAFDSDFIAKYPLPEEIDFDETPEDAADEELSYWQDDGPV